MRKTKCILSKEEIVKRYVEGESTLEISNVANVSQRRIRTILNEMNVQFRPRGSWKRKYPLNEHFFKDWSNNMAYILGFFVADGTVNEITQTVSFAQKDANILLKIREEIGSNQPLYYNKKTSVHLLNLNSKILKEDLMYIHGILPNKSRTIEFPKVPEEYLSHFIRGYFDGDGHINYKKYQIVFVGGSNTFMNKLFGILYEERKLNCLIATSYENFRIYVSGRKTVKEFANWIYHNSSLHLERKYQEFSKETIDSTLLTNRNNFK